MSKLTNKEMIKRIAEDLFPVIVRDDGEINSKGQAFFLSRQCQLLHDSIKSSEDYLAKLRAEAEDLRESYDGSEIKTVQIERMTRAIIGVSDGIDKKSAELLNFRDAHDDVAEAAWKPWSPALQDQADKKRTTASLAELDAALARGK